MQLTRGLFFPEQVTHETGIGGGGGTTPDELTNFRNDARGGRKPRTKARFEEIAKIACHEEQLSQTLVGKKERKGGGSIK